MIVYRTIRKDGRRFYLGEKLVETPDPQQAVEWIPLSAVGACTHYQGNMGDYYPVLRVRADVSPTDVMWSFSAAADAYIMELHRQIQESGPSTEWTEEMALEFFGTFEEAFQNRHNADWTPQHRAD